MLELVYEAEGRSHRSILGDDEVSIGRSSDNAVVLNDFSVSRRHAVVRREKDRVVLLDQNSTNGVKVNGRFVSQSPLAPGDVVTIGTFTLTVREDAQPALKKLDESTSTFIRSIADFNRDFHLDQVAPPESDEREIKLSGRRPAVSPGARGKIFEILVQVAKTLIVARESREILTRVLDLLFEYLPLERAAVVLLDEEGRTVPTLARQRGREGTVTGMEPFSHTIVDTVVRERVAVLTSDALADGRFEAGQSIRIQQIRSAMCVPLWNREKIIGALHVDTPLRAGTFSADDLDLLTALGNFAAVAVERARLQERIEREERIRERLSRYHSPGVVAEIASEQSGIVDRVRTRNVTVLFADLVGFTSLCESMEPETLSRFLGEFFTFAADAVFWQGGTLDKFIGDAVMAFFGAPISQPDHPRRAVASAQALVDAVERWSDERVARGESAVAVRIGINTGNCVVGDIGSDRRVDYTVLGNTVNVAARLEESVAGPNEIVLGEETARLAGADVEPLGEIRLKGLTKGLPAFRVRRAARRP